MHDQAEQLRERMLQNKKTRPTRLVTVTSGKGGVGKSNFSLNFGLGLIEKGHKAVLFDLDLGLANLDVLMGITPKKHLCAPNCLLDTSKRILKGLYKGECKGNRKVKG